MTAAKATDQILEAIVTERWRGASTRLQEFAGDDRPGWVNSEGIEAIHDNLRDLAYRMAGEGPNADQEEDIEGTFEALMTHIESTLRALALRIEVQNTRKAAAA